MRFALVNGQLQEAQPDLSGECRSCGEPTVAKCGEMRVWHWAHKGRRHCDPWWESETEWHRIWKDQFPAEWQEVIHPVGDGERHIADVKTSQGWVIEFQHSYIKPEERRSREAFYPKLIWVVDGTRRQRDRVQLANALRVGVPIGNWARKAFADDCGLLREWSDSSAPVFFDLGEIVLWWFFAKNRHGSLYVAPYSRDQFIESHRSTATDTVREFDEGVKELPRLVADFELRRPPLMRGDLLQPRMLGRRFRL
jgi:competence protein CoiA